MMVYYIGEHNHNDCVNIKLGIDKLTISQKGGLCKMAGKSFVNIQCPKCGEVVSGIYCPMCGKKLESTSLALYRATSRKLLRLARKPEGTYRMTFLKIRCFEMARYIQEQKYQKDPHSFVRLNEVFSQKDADEIETNLSQLFTWVKAFADKELQKEQAIQTTSQCMQHQEI